MATIVKEAVLEVAASDVWAVVSDVANVPELTGMVEASHMEGDTRFCTQAGGGELKETILSVDDDLMRMAYRVHESPFPISEHAASIVVQEASSGCRVTWTTDLKPDDAAPIFQEAADAMFADMVSRFGG